MKLSLLPLLSLSFTTTALPSPPDFALVGFAASNPLGPATGGTAPGSETMTVSSVPALISAVAGNTPRTIYLQGHFNLTARLRPGSNKSLIGTGPSGASITGAGITIIHSDNTIIRNLAIRDIAGNDGITVQNATRVWIDHNEFSSRFSAELGPDFFDGQLDVVRASDWITVSWNVFRDHWKSSLVGNSDALGDVDKGHLHVTYHHNHWKNVGTRGPAARFGRLHVFNNLYDDFLYQAIHSRSGNQVLVEGNVFAGKTREALSTYGLVIPEDSPNTSPEGDEEADGFANLGAENDFGSAGVNITQVGDFAEAPYAYKLTPLKDVRRTVESGAGLGKI